MAVEIKSIGTSSRDYSTIQAWEDDITNTTYTSASTTAKGECYDDSTFDETVTINANPSNVTEIILSVASGERHDGTAGTGARIVATALRYIDIRTPSGFNEKYTVEWLEIDGNGNQGALIRGNSQQFQNVGIVQYLILHGTSGSVSGTELVIDSVTRDLRVQRCIIYDATDAGTQKVGIALDSDRPEGGFLNNTAYKMENTNTSGTIDGVKFFTNDTDARVKNNIVVGTGGGASTVLDFNFPGTNPDSLNNLSSDPSADDGGGTGHVLSIPAGDLFVSTAAGSEDLHLKSSASDAIDAGVDLGTTPTGVNIDIDGRDVDAEADTWDIGADEFVAAAGGGSTHLLHTARQRQRTQLLRRPPGGFAR